VREGALVRRLGRDPGASHLARFGVRPVQCPRLRRTSPWSQSCEPTVLTLEPGIYWWCACGRSKDPAVLRRQPTRPPTSSRSSCASSRHQRGRPVQLQAHRQQAVLRRHPHASSTLTAPPRVTSTAGTVAPSACACAALLKKPFFSLTFSPRRLGQLAQDLVLLAAQLGRHRHLDVHVVVAVPRAPSTGMPLPLRTMTWFGWVPGSISSSWSPCRLGGLDRAAERRLHHADRHLAVDVELVALEARVGLDRHHHVEIARPARPWCRPSRDRGCAGSDRRRRRPGC
jgi:hypothetical protein